MTVYHHQRAVILAMALLFATPLALSAQRTGETTPTVDSLTRALGAPDLDARAMAVAALATYPPSDLPALTRGKLIALLEQRIGAPAGARDDDGEDGAEGLYVIALVRSVVALNEPAALRGLALVGVTVSADAQRFVASRGDAAIPYLVEAEGDTMTRSAVAATRARMLADYGSALSPDGQTSVRAALYHVASVDALAFANAARIGRLIDAGPALTILASAETDELTRALLSDAAAAANALRAQASVETLIASLMAELNAVCEGAVHPRHLTCQRLVSGAQLAFSELRERHPAQARTLLMSLASAAEDAGRRGIIPSLDAATISGSARYLATRV